VRARQKLFSRAFERRAATLECKQCHTDHKGRNADINQLDRETFDHDVTVNPAAK
jgi:hypothetical protein